MVIFCSDHGDHDLIGKGDFYEANIKVPLPVRLPWSHDATTVEGLASIDDITATCWKYVP